MGAEHVARSFDDELALLERSLLEMGQLALSQLRAALSNLDHSDLIAADKIIEADSKIDELNELVDRQAVRLLALRQPMGGDLRIIVSSLRIAGELERMGDYAAGLAKRTRNLGGLNKAAIGSDILNGLGQLGDKVAAQIEIILRAMADKDKNLAEICWNSDQQIDEDYSILHHKIVAAMQSHPEHVTNNVQLMFMAKHIERIGDHITNIAESLYYCVTGNRMTEPRPKSDTSYQTGAAS